MDTLHQIALIVKELFGVGLGTASIFIGKYVLKKLAERKQHVDALTESSERRFSALEQSLRALQHDRIYQLTDKYIERGYVSLDELENLSKIFESYKALGGNGLGERKFNFVQKLPVVNEPGEIKDPE